MPTLDVQEPAAVLLKHHTAQTHQALEQMVWPQLQRLYSMNDYSVLLKNFYGYFKPVEQLIEAQVDETILPDLKQRRKADAILQDLTFSKAHIDDLPIAHTLPEIATINQALGAMYVLEGSTLGGRGITKILLKNQQLQLTENHLHFFNGYGAETGAMWMGFLKTLNQFGAHSHARKEMVAAANETFTLFQHWLQTRL